MSYPPPAYPAGQPASTYPYSAYHLPQSNASTYAQVPYPQAQGTYPGAQGYAAWTYGYPYQQASQAARPPIAAPTAAPQSAHAPTTFTSYTPTYPRDATAAPAGPSGSSGGARGPRKQSNLKGLFTKECEHDFIRYFKQCNSWFGKYDYCSSLLLFCFRGERCPSPRLFRYCPSINPVAQAGEH